MKYFIIRSKNKLKIGLVIIFTIIMNYFSLTAYQIVNNFDKELLQSPWTENILLNTGSASYLYASYVFIIAGLMYADSLVIDKETGLQNIISCKISRRKYVFKTLIYNFLLAGFFAIFPVFINILAWFCVRGNVPLTYFNTMNIFNDDLFVAIFLKSKLLFYLLHLMKIFIVAGIIATFALAINTRFNNRFIGLCLPLIFDSLSLLFTAILNIPKGNVSLISFLSTIIKADYLTFMILFAFSIISLILIAKEINKKDILWI